MQQIETLVSRVASKPYDASLARWEKTVVSADPDALLKAWNKRDVWMFGDEADQGSGEIRKFLNAASPIRVWYKAELYTRNTDKQQLSGIKSAMVLDIAL